MLGDRVQRGSAGEGNHRCPQSALPSLGRDLHRGLLETTLALETKTRTVDEHVLRPDDSSTAEETADQFFFPPVPVVFPHVRLWQEGKRQYFIKE